MKWLTSQGYNCETLTLAERKLSYKQTNFHRSIKDDSTRGFYKTFKSQI
jgi:hypothetical protein